MPTNGSDLEFFGLTAAPFLITADIDRTFNSISFAGSTDFQISSGGGATLLGLSGLRRPTGSR